MIFLILTLAFLIISTIFVYRTARDNGYKAILWTIASIGAFVGVQLLFGIIYGLILGILIATGQISNPSDSIAPGLGTVINLAAIAASVGAVLLILRHVNQIGDDEQVNLPPAPPNFN